jgi:hypothetical protein
MLSKRSAAQKWNHVLPKLQVILMPSIAWRSWR